MKKTCIRCKREKPVEEFHHSKAVPGGYTRHCKRCVRLFMRRWYKKNSSVHLQNVRIWKKKNRTDVLAKVCAYLRVHPCVDCAERDIVVLEFDHVRGEKVKAICTLIGNNAKWPAVKREMAKCVVRCANCHRRKTAKQFGYAKFIASEALLDEHLALNEGNLERYQAEAPL